MATKSTKYKLSELAKDLELTNNDIINCLAELSSDAKKSQSALSPEEISYVLEYFTQKNQVENFNAYYADNQKPEDIKKQEKEAKAKAEAEKKAAEEKAAAEKKAAEEKAEAERKAAEEKAEAEKKKAEAEKQKAESRKKKEEKKQAKKKEKRRGH